MKTRSIGGILFLCAAVSLAGDPDDAKRSDEADKTAKQLQERIRAEVKSLGDHAWAGEYYQGDGLGVNVSFLLAPGAGYVFEWHGCLGLYDRNYGSLTFTNGRIRLSFTFKNERKGFQGIAEDFTPVPWGNRRYLVPSDEIIGFCNEVNDGSEPRDGPHGTYLMRRGDEKTPVSGFPDVPRDYRGYLLANPIRAGIIGIGSVTTRPSVCEWRFKDTTVILDAGKDKGLRVGMGMRIVTPDDRYESVRITKVEDTRSEAVISQIGEEEPGPQTGWRLSTRCRWHEEDEETAPPAEP